MRWLNRHFIIELIAIAIYLPAFYVYTDDFPEWLRLRLHRVGPLLLTMVYAIALVGIVLPARKGASKLVAFALFIFLLFMSLLLPAMLPASQVHHPAGGTKVEQRHGDASRLRELAYQHERGGDFDAAIRAREEVLWRISNPAMPKRGSWKVALVPFAIALKTAHVRKSATIN